MNIFSHTQAWVVYNFQKLASASWDSYCTLGDIFKTAYGKKYFFEKF